MKINKYVLICLAVILIDQVVKLLVHFNMELGYAGEIRVIGNWARLHYLHNPGMAFGLELDYKYGKLILTLFRIVAITGLAYFFSLQLKRQVNSGLLICLALILGGAIGNGIDSVFYGVFFGIQTPDAMTPWFHGMVIDMLYFPMFSGTYPSWIPFVEEGTRFTFFSAIFNIADSAIFIGAVSILLFNRRFFAPAEEEEPSKSAEEPINDLEDSTLSTEEKTQIASIDSTESIERSKEDHPQEEAPKEK
ncbi:MAG: lipoprotein signal peptidase [Bacteroidota bacterium]